MREQDILDPIETWRPDQLDELESAALRRQLDYLTVHSDFYRQKFADLDVSAESVTGVHDLPKLPLTVKEELRDSLAAHPPLGAHQAAPMASIVQIQATSGTTGSPSYFGLTSEDLLSWGTVGARAFYAGGFRPGDLVLHGWGMSRGFAGGVPGVRVLQQLGCVVLPIGGEAGAERLLQVASAMRPKGFCSGPTFALHLGQVCPEVLDVQAKDLGIEHLVVGGEPGGGVPEIRDAIEKLWGATSCETLGNSDVTPIVFAECLDRSGMHLVAQGETRAELIDPDSLEPVAFEAGASGELVLTALRRQASPLVRFRTRDFLDVLAVDCPCGRSGPKVRCVGRTDDMLIVRGINVWPSAVREVVMTFQPMVTGNMRIVADFPGHATDRRLGIRVEYADHLDMDGQDRLRGALEQRITQRLAFRPHLTLEPPGALPPMGVNKTSLVERVTTAG